MPTAAWLTSRAVARVTPWLAIGVARLELFGKTTRLEGVCPLEMSLATRIGIGASAVPEMASLTDLNSAGIS
jgi:hypothetical protein